MFRLIVALALLAMFINIVTVMYYANRIREVADDVYNYMFSFRCTIT